MPDYRFYAGDSYGLAWVPVSDECGSDAEAFMVAERLASDLMGAEVVERLAAGLQGPAQEPCRSASGEALAS